MRSVQKQLRSRGKLLELYILYVLIVSRVTFQHSAHLSIRRLLLRHKRVWMGWVEFHGWPVRGHWGRRRSTRFVV